MLNRNEILNGKQNLWEIAEVAVYDAQYGLAGFPNGAAFQLHEWAPEPERGSAELYVLGVETGRVPMRIGFTRQQVVAFSHPTRAARIAMKSRIMDCLQRLAAGEDTTVRLADGVLPPGGAGASRR